MPGGGRFDEMHKSDGSMTSRTYKWTPCWERWRDGGSYPPKLLDVPHFVRDGIRLVVGGWMKEAEPLHLQTRKKISEDVKMTRDVGEGEIGVAVCSAEEKSSDEAHDGGVPGAA